MGFQSGWLTSVGLGMQLFLSHAVAAAVAIAFVGPRWRAIAVVTAVVAGMALTFTVQRTLWLVGSALARLSGPQPPAALPARWHGPLAGLVAQINGLLAREREVYDLRESLLARARDAAAQQERNRLARNLHDSIKQQIFSISMSAAAVQARWDADPQGAREALDDVRRSAQEAMVEMKALLQQLSPAPLEKVGLVQALRDQCEALGYRTDAEVTVEFGELPADDCLPAGTQESVFRIAQEAFSNVARHARADHVRLYVGQRDAGGPLTLEVQDDGQGFEVGRQERGMGLENIRQRVLALGGKLDVDSAPGKGTTLRVAVPLAASITYEEEAMYGQNHTLNKVFLSGLSGGLALIAALFYPLYVLVPGRSVGGWPGGLEAVGPGLGVVAALLAIGTGFLAARWAKAGTRQGGALFGALAGGVAGAVLFFSIGAPAAAVTGGAELLKRGLVPAAGWADLICLLAEPVIGIVWWSHGAFWAALVAGLGLGAIGGLLVPASPRTSDQPDLCLPVKTILTAAAIVSALSVLSGMAKFMLLEPTIRDGLIANGVSLETNLSLDRISDWLIGTPALFYVASLIGLYVLLRADLERAEDPVRLGAARGTAALLTFVALGVPVYLGAMSLASAQGTTLLPRGWMDVTGLMFPSPVSVVAAIGAPLLGLVLVGSLVMAGLYVAAITTAHRRQRALGLTPAHPVYDVAVASILLSPGIVAWAVRLPPVWGIAVGLVMIIVAVAFIATLLCLSKERPSYTITLGQLRLMISQAVHAGLGSAVAMVIPLMTVISTDVSMDLITNQLVEVLLGYEFAAQEFTLVELVRDVYLAQASAFVITFVAAAVVVGLLTLIVSGMVSIPEQLTAQGAETA